MSTAGKGAKASAREERLAQALRDNLHRRKAQARQRAEPAGDDKPSGPEDSTLKDD